MIQNCKTQLQQTVYQSSLLLDKTYQKPKTSHTGVDPDIYRESTLYYIIEK